MLRRARRSRRRRRGPVRHVGGRLLRDGHEQLPELLSASAAGAALRRLRPPRPAGAGPAPAARHAHVAHVERRRRLQHGAPRPAAAADPAAATAAGHPAAAAVHASGLVPAAQLRRESRQLGRYVSRRGTRKPFHASVLFRVVRGAVLDAGRIGHDAEQLQVRRRAGQQMPRLAAGLEPHQLDADERPRTSDGGAKQPARRVVRRSEQGARRQVGQAVERTASPLGEVGARRLVALVAVVRLVGLERAAESRRPERGLLEERQRAANLPVDEARAPRTE